ncbi:hypothetical protein HYT23_02730 [Candidatus Pacearchaeota archaeon]|nr:hypothetical protein [Candidatus Pacearchaeota archaeon]
MNKIINLCCSGGCCPTVEILNEEVRIGEEGNICVLKREEFESLKQKILEKAL